MPSSENALTGEIAIYTYGFVPDGWLACEGQRLAVADYPALFRVIGNRFGGDGTASFALPDLRGAAAMGAGSAPGLTLRLLGKRIGSEAVALSAAQTAHSHRVVNKGNTRPDADKTSRPLSTSTFGSLTIKRPGKPSITEFSYSKGQAPNTFLHAGTVGQTGGGVPHENRQPYLALAICICTAGGDDDGEA